LTRVVDLPDDDPKVVEDVLHHLYTGHYEVVPKAHRRRPSLEHLLHHVGIYVLADKWDMQPLRRLAVDQFLEDGANVRDTHTLIDAVEQIYLRSSGKNDLRLAAVSLVKYHSDESSLRDEDEERLKKIRPLGRDLLALYMRAGSGSLRLLACGGCHSPRKQLISCPLNVSYWCKVCGQFR